MARLTARLVPLVAVVAALAGGACSLREEDDPARAATPAHEPTLAIAWGDDPLADPRALDPAFARASGANVLLNVMDPLVKLDRDLVPRPHLAARWEVSRGGREVTFTLRRGARWTNGDPVTAYDFEFAWKRVLAPELRAPNAEALFAIRGARAYHECAGEDCSALAERVGVHALDAGTLAVRLRAPAPWFPAQVAGPAFLAVHPATVNRNGRRWTDPAAIVTNGPFALDRAEPGRRLVLVKDPGWRDARAVGVGRVDGRIIVDPLARVQAFDSGEVVALDGSPLPATEMPALRERAEYARYPALGTYYYAFNVDTVSDVHQRRAMALAIDREHILEQLGRGDEVPALGLTPPGVPGFDEVLAASPWLPDSGDLAHAKAELARASTVKQPINVFFRDSSRNRAIAEAVRDSWRKLGIRTRIRGERGAEYVGFLRPPNTGIDVFQVALRYHIPDPVAGLARWTCRAERNYSHYCDGAFDATLRRAGSDADAEERNAAYAAAEAKLFGERGAVPLIPIYWSSRSNLEALRVKDSFFVNPLGQIDLTNVEVR